MPGVPCRTNRGAMEMAVSVAGLRKRYGVTEAVRGISFEIAPGQIFGLLGPNGAGKTTTLECILGLRRPDEGSIRICGLDPRTHATQTKRLVGAQLQAASLQDKITPRQALALFGSFYPQAFADDELLERFELEDKADAPFVTLSGGQKQRLFLALAVIQRPAVLVLDEPTAGLDPHARRELRSLIGSMRAEGRTVLLSTHDLEEAAQLCDRVAVLDAGRIVAEGAPAELIGRARTPSQVTVRTAPPLPEMLVESLPGLAGALYEDGVWILQTPTPAPLLAELVRRADEAGAELLDVAFRRPSLEDVLIELTGRPRTGA
jgi:ABC-2 type transport system ATP-binding protein